MRAQLRRTWRQVGAGFLLLVMCAPCLSAEPALRALEASRGVHPRLFLDVKRVAALKAAIPGYLSPLWERLRKQADAALAQPPPAYGEGEGGMAQIVQQQVGNHQPLFALAYLLTGKRAYLTAAREWALASATYPKWGTGTRDGTDLATGHQLFGLALVYDWLYRDLDKEARAAIRGALVRRADYLYLAASTPRSAWETVLTGHEGRAYWQEWYLQNHLWANMAGLAAAGLALFDDPEAGGRAQRWVALALQKFRRTEESLGPDGASQEGVAYWSYGVEHLLKFWDLASALLGENSRSPWWHNTAKYRLYMSLPRDAWRKQNVAVDIADSPRHDFYGADYQLRRLASLYKDPYAQWLAGELSHTGFAVPESGWLNLLWHDPQLAPTHPRGLPALRHFEDMGIVSSRSDWSGQESLVVFKCGPPIGHAALKNPANVNGNGGHAHPDANQFVLFGAGEWLVRDDGYMWKMTEYHNTLLVDGKGQLDENVMWYKPVRIMAEKAAPRVLSALSKPAFDYIAGDAAAAYPRELGMRRYLRRLLFLKPGVLIVADDIQLDEPHALELRLHPEYPPVPQPGGEFLCRGSTSMLRIQPLRASGTEISVANLEARRHISGTITLPTIRVHTRAAKWRHVVALSWSHAAGTPATVKLLQGDNAWMIETAGKRAVLPWDRGEPRVDSR